MIYKENNKHIGNLKIYNISKNEKFKSAEYSRFIGDRNYWGIGLGFELGMLALGYCFDNLELDCVEAGCSAENIAAVKSNKRLGFKEHKRIKNKEGKIIIRFKIMKEELME